MVFHNGHVLVGSGVEDVVDAVGLEQAAHALFVPDIGNDGLQAPGFDVLLKGQGGLGQGGLGYIGSYQKVGLEAQALADDLFAYGTGTAGDEYGLTFDGSLNGVQAQGDGRTVEEVLKFDVPQLVDLQVILYPGFRDGHFLDLHLVLQALVDKPDAPLFSQAGANGNNGGLDVVFLNDGFKAFVRIVDRYAVEVLAVHFLIVVKVGHHAVVVVDVLLQHLIQLCAQFPGPKDSGVDAGSAVVHAPPVDVCQGAQRQPEAAGEGDEDHGVYHNDLPVVVGLEQHGEEEGGDEEGGRGGQHSQKDITGISQPGEADDDKVGLENIKGQPAQGEQYDEPGPNQEDALIVDVHIVSQQ